MDLENDYSRTIPHEINTRYLIKKELGKGAYGTVYLAVDRTTGEQYELILCVYQIELQLRGSTMCSELEQMPKNSARNHNSSSM